MVMTETAYPVARAAAVRIHRHLAQLDKATGPLVDEGTLEAAIQVAFWASLRREEGQTPRVSLALFPWALDRNALRLRHGVTVTPEALTKLGPAVDRPGIHVGVWHLGVWPIEGLLMWGTTHDLPPYCPVVEIIAPGLLAVKYSRGETAGKFVNIAVIEGDRIKMIDQSAASVPDCPALLTPLLGLESQFRSEDSQSSLIQLAVSMRAHGRGGTLLVVPSASDDLWGESILAPIRYALFPSESIPLSPRDIDSVAGLTAADGATILNDRFEVLAFGAKIIRRRGSPQVAQVTLSEPIEGSVAAVVETAQLGGTRHISAAQFTHDQHQALAMVASQDGRFTLFGWSACDDMVHARRVESLLL